MDITISTCGSSIQDTYLYLLRSNGGLQAENDVYYEGGCSNVNHAYIKIENLSAGVYYIVSEGYDRDGEITTNIEGIASVLSSSGNGDTSTDAINIGILSVGFNYSDTKNTNSFTNSHGYTSGNNVFYKFTITVPMDITVSHCGSSVTDTYISLDNGTPPYTSWVGYNDNSWDTGACDNPSNAFLRMYSLEPGTYYVISSGVSSNGSITTNIKGVVSALETQPGNDLSDAIDIGTKYFGFTFRDTRTNEFHTDDYQCPQESDPYYLEDMNNDIFYKFTLSKMMDVIISNEGPELFDSYIHLLDVSGNCIAHNKDGAELGTYSSIQVSDLAAGTYYVVTEGYYNYWGILTTTIQGSFEAKVSTDQNYILTTTPTIPTPIITNLSATEKHQTIQYYDGLGRPKQTIQIKNGNNYEDLVNFQEYDEYGRYSKAWLPAVVADNNGEFVSLPAFKLKAQETYKDETKPYSSPVYEASPLERVNEKFGPGQEWHNNSRAMRTSYLTNIGGNDTLNCIQYTLTPQTSTSSALRDTSRILTLVKSYDSAELFVTRTTNEDGNTVLTFTDKFGRTVLIRRIQRDGTSKTNYDTYYIYDDFDNLVAVLPPEASEVFKTGTSWLSTTNTQLKQYAFLYIYDNLKQCTAKKLPGCSWNLYIYDKASRLIFSQDGVQRKKGQWLFCIPDVFGRTCLTGICGNTELDALGVIPFSNTAIATRDNVTTAYKGYSLSGISLTNPKLLTVNYYDDYNFLNRSAISEFNNSNFVYDALTGFNTRYTSSAKGLQTGTLSAKLDDGTTQSFLGAVMYYDDRGRVIQTKSGNHMAGMEKEYTAYNFSDQPTSRKHIHSASGQSTQTEIYTYSYDHAGRLKKTQHQLNGGTTVTLVDNVYDQIGRLESVKRNNKTNLTSIYTYNIRSWITSITNPLFSENLYYNESYGGNEISYNGNISAMKWKTSNESTTRGYSFNYNNLGMITSAQYMENETSSTKYTTDYDYDKNGNIKSLSRNGLVSTGTFGVVDNLTYSYMGNQLVKVEDSGTSVNLSRSEDFVDRSHVALEYCYDANGNMTKDLNKGISLIEYNSLNLPAKLVISNSNGQATNTYTYSADGRKLKVSKGSMVTDYAGNMIYEDDNLRRILVDGGYIEYDEYHFYVTDHLGNIRVETNAAGNELYQVNHYYPFGMSFGEGFDSTNQPYKYNGKEMDYERGLNLYDYGARMYDPALGRFHTQDRFAEKYHDFTPYQYGANNPVLIIDVNGDSIWISHRGNDYLYDNGKLFLNGSEYTGKVKGFLKQTVTALGQMGNAQEGQSLLSELQSSTNSFTITKGSSNRFDPQSTVKAGANLPEVQAATGNTIGSNGSGGTIYWNPNTAQSGFNTAGNRDRPSFIGLAHEMFHGRDANKGMLHYEKDYINPLTGVKYTATKFGLEKSEWSAVYQENVLRGQLAIPLRTNYGIQEVSPGVYQPLPPRLLNSNNQPTR